MSSSLNKYFAQTGSVVDGVIAANKKKTAFDSLKENHFPEAKWNIGGAFRFDKSIQTLSTYLKTTMQGYINIGTVSGSPSCLWSLDWYKPRPLTRLSIFKELLDTYAQFNMAVSINFDNPVITDAQLSDAVGNKFLAETHNHDRLRANSIMVASDKLANHIKQYFPKTKVRAGVNRLVFEPGKRTTALYENLAEKYERVSIHPADNNRWDILEALQDKDKFEITLNDTCLRLCPVRRDHMIALARIRENPYSAEMLQLRHKYLNLAGCERIFSASLDQNSSLLTTMEEWQRLYNMGFRRFRIQSESLRNEITLIWEAARCIWGSDPKISEKVALLTHGFIASLNTNSETIPSGLKNFSLSSYE